MLILAKIGEILGSPAGSFVYHLVLLLTLLAALGMALDERQRGQREWAGRLVAVATGLVVARLCYVVPALLTFTPWITPAILPPLERLADLASIALLGWAFVPQSRSRGRFWNGVVAVNLLAAVAMAAGFSLLWKQALVGNPGADYNAFWQSTVWTAWQIGLLLLIGIGAWSGPVQEKGLFLVAMLFLLAGTLLQLTYPLQVPGLPVWVRLANLIAYPLVVVAIYQRIVSHLHLQAGYLQDISQASLDQIKSLLTLLETSRQMTTSLELPAVLDNAVQGVARALGADQCAIAFPMDGDPSHMRLEAIYNPARSGRGEPVEFPLEYQLAIQQALRRKKHVMVEELDNIQLKVLFALLGSGETGPLLVQPLVLEGEALGVMIVGNARSRRPFSSHEAKLCQSLAEQLAVAIRNARRHHAVQDRLRELQGVDGRLAEKPREPRLAGGGEEDVSLLTEPLAAFETGGEATV